MRGTSLSRRCLICFAYCPSPTSGQNEKNFKTNIQIAGTAGCKQLQTHLENVFILRKLLDIPAAYMEELLVDREMEGSESDLEVSAGSPGDWFVMCEPCMQAFVSKAWKVYQSVVALELKMVKVKKAMKEKMKTEVRNPANNPWIYRSTNTTEGKIRRYVLPDWSMPIADEISKIEEYEIEEILLEEGFDDDMDNRLNEDGCLSNGFTDNPVENDVLYEPDSPFENSDDEDISYTPTPTKSHLKTPRKRRRKKKVLNGVGPATTKRVTYNWYRCKEVDCGARYTSPEEISAHTELHDQRRLKSVNGEFEKGETDCPQCSFPARDRMELEVHMAKRHGEGERVLVYKCPQCDFVTHGNFQVFKSHYDEEHPAPGSSSNLTSADGVNVEKKSSDLPVECPTCGKRSKTLRSYYIHQKHMHPEQLGIAAEEVECDQCGMKFTSKVFLEFHVNSVHRVHLRFICDVCGRGFQFMSKLERHKTAHLDNQKKEFVCSFCGLDYALKSVLDSHYRNCHPNETAKASGENPPSSSTEEQYKCKYCEVTSPFRAVLKRHLQQHKEEIGHRCEQCGKCYTSEPGLKRHIRINHSNELWPCPHCSKPFPCEDYLKDHIKKFCRMAKTALVPVEPSAGISGSQSGAIVDNNQYGTQCHSVPFPYAIN